MLACFRLRSFKAFVAGLLTLLAWATAAFAEAPTGAPEDRFWVTDQASVLSLSATKIMTDNAKAFEEETTHQVVVITVNSLAGWTIERYAEWLGNTWGVGQADVDNGVVLLVAPKERRVRIEVGRGLRSDLPDRAAKRIIDDVILPKFRDGDLEGGIVAGQQAIMEALGARFRSLTDWEEFIFALLLPLFGIGRFLGLGDGFSGGGGSFGGGSFGGGGASGSW